MSQNIANSKFEVKIMLFNWMAVGLAQGIIDDNCIDDLLGPGRKDGHYFHTWCLSVRLSQKKYTTLHGWYLVGHLKFARLVRTNFIGHFRKGRHFSPVHMHVWNMLNTNRPKEPHTRKVKPILMHLDWGEGKKYSS